jgi:hypothetical protein
LSHGKRSDIKIIPRQFFRFRSNSDNSEEDGGNMNIGLDPLRILYLVSFLLLTGAIAACTNLQGVGQVAGAVAQAELFKFKHLRLHRDPAGIYGLTIKIVNQCRTTQFTEDQLFETFRTGVYRRTAGGVVADTGVEFQFTFDLMAACNSPGEVHYETADLVVPVTDANGNVTYQHPHGIDADLSGGGVLDINIIDDHFHVYNPAQVKATGPMTLDRIEIPGGVAGGSSGDTYTTANIVNPYFVFNLTGILANPGRVAGDFAFTAKKAPNDDDLLVVWDGEFVLRTDI